jgi:phenylacetic acid degradation operon negative regulatory protein
MILFDLPEEKRAVRNELRKQLKAAHFGGLQRSAWITPDPIDCIGESLKKIAAASGVMAFFEGIPCGGERPEEIVASAWNFSKIHSALLDHQNLLKSLPPAGSDLLDEKLLEWAREEKQSWALCMRLDPLLPRALWPKDYPGEAIWKIRIATLRQAAELSTDHRDKE